MNNWTPKGPNPLDTVTYADPREIPEPRPLTFWQAVRACGAILCSLFGR